VKEYFKIKQSLEMLALGKSAIQQLEMGRLSKSFLTDVMMR
jgi:hypothetical protein